MFPGGGGGVQGSGLLGVLGFVVSRGLELRLSRREL